MATETAIASGTLSHMGLAASVVVLPSSWLTVTSVVVVDGQDPAVVVVVDAGVDVDVVDVGGVTVVSATVTAIVPDSPEYRAGLPEEVSYLKQYSK